jgi:hypothetical protein
VLDGFETEEFAPVTVHDGLRDDHLCVQPNIRGEQPYQVAEMPIRPIHHRRNGQACSAWARQALGRLPGTIRFHDGCNQ